MIFVFFFFFFLRIRGPPRSTLDRSAAASDVYKRQSLYILNSFASKTFAENLFDNEEGKAIGLSYFHERGFSDETIRKFELGYSLADWSAFSEHAIKNGYKSEFIIKTGLGYPCLLYTSDAADERSSVDLGGRRIIKKKK